MIIASHCHHRGWCLPSPIALPVPTGSPHAAKLPVEDDAAVKRMPCAPSLPLGGRHFIVLCDILHQRSRLSPTMHEVWGDGMPQHMPRRALCLPRVPKCPLRMTPAMLY